MVPEPGSGGSSETGTQDMGQGAGGWNVPARSSGGSPSSGEILWGNQLGLCQHPAPQRGGFEFGDAQRGCRGAGWDLLPGEPQERGVVPEPQGTLCRGSCAQGWSRV